MVPEEATRSRREGSAAAPFATRSRGSPASQPEYDAAELLAHVTGSDPDAAWRSRRRDAGRGRSTSSSRAGRTASRCSTSPARPHFRYVTLGSAPASSCRGPRPRCWPAGRSTAHAAREAPVVVDLCTGSGAIALAVATEVPVSPGARRRAGRGRRRVGRGATWPGAASTCATATWRDAFPELDGTVDVVVSNPPYIPWRPMSRSSPRSATTTPPWRSGRAVVTGLTRCGSSRRRPRGCSGPGGASAPSTPTSRASQRSRRVQLVRPVGRGTRQPRPGRSATVRHRAAGTISEKSSRQATGLCTVAT